jgi:hypothetical protein
MSRGYGVMMQVLSGVLRKSAQPMTFDQIRRKAFPEAFKPGYELRASAERSLRRALKNLVDRGSILATGEGGPGDPKRYRFAEDRS